jgi:prepilin-type N-terminal cleavage/methylation domain-containing protein
MASVQGSQNSEAETTFPNRLQLSDIVCRFENVSDGFTLIETLIVVLVIGILCATGVSMYSGATADSQMRSISDELTGFFTACRHRAIMRKTPVKVTYHNQNLGIEQSSGLKLRIPELSQESGNKVHGMTFNDKIVVLADGTRISQLELNVYLPGKRLGTLTVEL